jgi:hypothetical protein
VESEGGSSLQVVRYGSVLVVWWRAGDDSREERRFSERDLASLGEESRLLRGVAANCSSAHLAEVLRTLGQDLDTMRADAIGIVEEPDGFFLTASSSGGHLMRTYTAEEVLRLSQQRRQARSSQGYSPPLSGEERWARVHQVQRCPTLPR